MKFKKVPKFVEKFCDIAIGLFLCNMFNCCKCLSILVRLFFSMSLCASAKSVYFSLLGYMFLFWQFMWKYFVHSICINCILDNCRLLTCNITQNFWILAKRSSSIFICRAISRLPNGHIFCYSVRMSISIWCTFRGFFRK